jgi:hypothetical protein
MVKILCGACVTVNRDHGCVYQTSQTSKQCISSMTRSIALLVWVIHKEVLEWWKNTEKKSWVDWKKAALQERMLGKRAEWRDVEKGTVREKKKEL